MVIYKNEKSYPIPDLDLLTICFDSEHSSALPESILHCSAEKPSISLNKLGLQRLLEEFAWGIRKRFNIGANGRNKDVVCIFSSGQPAYPAATFGVIAAGGVASLVSPSSTSHEVARQVTSGLAKVLICSEDFVETARKALKEIEYPVTLCVLRTEPDWGLRIDGDESDAGELRGSLASERLTWERITDTQELKDSLIMLLYSSGTTGVPKGVCLSHYNFVAELIILSTPARAFLAKAVAAGAPLPPPNRALAHLPAAHIAGVMSYIIAPPFSGGTVYWMAKYTWPLFLRLAGQCRITTIYTVPSIYLRMAKDPAVKDQFRWLYRASAGAAPIDGALQVAAGKKVGSGHVSQTWGLSETTGAVTAPTPGGEQDVSGSISPVVPNVELRFVDGSDQDVPEGQPGEILVRGPIVTKGYFNNPEATKAAFRNGWFATGDIGVVREGRFYIVDRLKELIKYKGLQVAPAEIEGLLITHPHILEAAVVGIPEAEAAGDTVAHSEVPRAYVVRVPGTAISADEVKNFVKEKLAQYKQLRGGVVFVDELPKNALNKVLRRELRDLAVKEVRTERARL
ncbi:4-coumarate-CoA ligase [Microthyrium microscopicum]|uniref:4-coumarate-CoA ligase n=1 Tax=Microthyrium microscopicum TaxID=703497 RepID=A0A6A6UNR4_9PEZI|nr:4-coumarate-CoA ligase [Microthyrium microscopicum]